jgi:hypothetical protein
MLWRWKWLIVNVVVLWGKESKEMHVWKWKSEISIFRLDPSLICTNPPCADLTPNRSSVQPRLAVCPFLQSVGLEVDLVYSCKCSVLEDMEDCFCDLSRLERRSWRLFELECWFDSIIFV